MTLINNEFNYYNFDNEINNNTINYLKNKWLNYDNDWYKTKYKYVKTAKRSPKTQYGIVENIYRKCYLNLENNEYFYPLDNYIKIKKRKRIIDILENIVIKNSGNGKRQCDIKDIIPNSHISKMSITNIMKNTKINIEKPKEKKIVLENEKLFVNMDDCFLNLLNDNKKQKYRIRTISANNGTDLKKSTKNRNVLKDKKIIFMKTKNGQIIKKVELIDKIYDFLNSNFIYNKSSLVFIGDGAPWIKTSAKSENIPYLIDRYHACKTLKKAFIFNRKWKIKKC
ncbi:Mbov_0401 family ICE element transposase-like protein [Spiroplasma endosymbiont of Nebria brevicollis]|uniref:Mbov_0401 family ICE element transposase-like protein n=1 Tax=Spiroplasma endosymbiont of Nebria brevicollis TaxID=3066284 RepID=UPI00313BF882